MASWKSFTSGRSGFSRGFPNSRISAPPEKALLEPISTTALTAASASAVFRCWRIAARSALPRPLTGGLFIVMTATPSRTAYWATSLMVSSLRDRRPQSQALEERAIFRRFRVCGGEQLLAEEHGIRAGEKAQRLHGVGHALATRRKADPRLGHGDARRGDGPHELQFIDLRRIRERRSGNGNEIVDRHALRIGIEARELRDQRRAVAPRLAHADDAAAAHAQARGAHALERLEAIAVLARADDLPVELG